MHVPQQDAAHHRRTWNFNRSHSGVKHKIAVLREAARQQQTNAGDRTEHKDRQIGNPELEQR